MAIETVDELGFGSGSETQESVSYTVLYQVYTNNRQDGIKTVLNHPLFRLNRSYSFGAESDPFALLKVRNAQLKERNGHRQLWVVTCTFEADLPSAEYPSWEIMFAASSERATGEFIESVNILEDGRERVVSTRLGGVAGGDRFFGSICNSAFTPSDPQPEIPSYNMLLRHRMRIKTLTEKKTDAIGLINSKPYYINASRVFAREFPKWTLRLNDIIVPPIVAEDTKKEVVWELEYNPKTWLFYDLDRGRARKLTAPSDDGETVTSSVVIEAEDGEPPVEPITDARGNVLVDPVAFDGFGLPLTKPDALQVFNKWLIGKEVDFKDIIKE